MSDHNFTTQPETTDDVIARSLVELFEEIAVVKAVHFDMLGFLYEQAGLDYQVAYQSGNSELMDYTEKLQRRWLTLQATLDSADFLDMVGYARSEIGDDSYMDDAESIVADADSFRLAIVEHASGDDDNSE